MNQYITKDSGKRMDYPTGMRRDTQENKPRFDLVWQPMLLRLAELYERGARKYSENNWQKADTPEELTRFRASAYRHFYQWFNGLDSEEDHAAAALWNIFCVEYVKEKTGLDNNGEYWEDIPGIKNYQVSNKGAVRRTHDGKIMSQWTNVWGYKMVSVSGEARKHYQVHRLVIAGFIGTPSEHHTQVNHRDGCKSNNDVFNLEYVTASENIRHAFDKGLMRPHPTNAKIDFEKAEEIRLLVDSGVKQGVVAKKFGISPQSVCDIMKSRTWRIRNGKVEGSQETAGTHRGETEEPCTSEDGIRGDACHGVGSWGAIRVPRLRVPPTTDNAVGKRRRSIGTRVLRHGRKRLQKDGAR